MAEFRIEVFTPRSTVDDFEVINSADFDTFIQRLRNTNWAKQAAQVPWAGNGWPGMAIVREVDNARFWFVAYDWQIDFGVRFYAECDKQTLGFVIGVTGLADDLDVSCQKSQRKMTECNFLYTMEEDLEDLASYFFDCKDALLVSSLLRVEPINRF